MDWEKKLKDLNGYNISFEIKQGYYHIALEYDENWSILNSDNENIYIQEKNGLYHYIASTDSVKVEDMFNLIDTTIKYNLDLEKKLILFKQKTEELQELFSNEEYDTLQTIEFKFKKKNTLKKTTRKTKNKTEEKAKKTRTKTKQKKEITKKEKITEDIVENKINQIETSDYDNDEEIVVMSNEYFEELEHK
jgi:hypothetical protein